MSKYEPITDEEIRYVARAYCRHMGIHPDETEMVDPPMVGNDIIAALLAPKVEKKHWEFFKDQAKSAIAMSRAVSNLPWRNEEGWP